MHPHYKFWPKRLPHAITLPDTSLWDNLETSARRYPNKAALVFFGRVFSYREVLQKAERLAACLRGLGVNKGDRVGVLIGNQIEYPESEMAIVKAGAIRVPMLIGSNVAEVRRFVEFSDAVAVR